VSDLVKKRPSHIIYEKFVQEGIALGRRPELVGGGLLRSVGDWFQVLSLRRKGIRKVSKACQGE
jgi:hypothetical protein